MEPTFYEFTLPLLGKVEFPAYSTLLTIGLAIALLIVRREEDRLGRNGDRVVDMGLWMIAFGLLGARLLSVLADGKLHDFIHLCTDPTLVEPRAMACTTDAQCGADFVCNQARAICHRPRDCLAWLKFWNGGLAYYGGFLLAAPIGLWYARRKKLGTWRMADMLSPLIAFGLFWGRMGCFFNGCCYGEPTDSFVGVHFPHRVGDVHPTQLYEAAGALGIWAILYFVVRTRKRAHGQVFGWLLVLYGVMRFLLEFWRDDARGALAGLSTSQWISIPLVALGAYFAVRRGARSPGAAAAPAGGGPAAAGA